MEKSIIVLALVTLCFGISVATEDDLILLEREAQQTGIIFQQAWNKSGIDMYTMVGLKKYGKYLSQAEMRIIIAYTYENPRFFQALNTDLRENYKNLCQQKYPQATRVLTNALNNLRKHQQIPRTLYRKENSSIVIPKYKDVMKNGNVGQLEQFTSTCGSTKEQANEFPEGDMINTLNNMPAGAYIRDSSAFPSECEVLLPRYLYYRVDNIKEYKPKSAEISSTTPNRQPLRQGCPTSCAVNISNISLYLSVTIVIFIFGPN